MPATQTDRLDGILTSTAIKPPCRTVALGPITFVGSAPYGYQTINSIHLTDNVGTGAPPDRVLLAGQADKTQNGIWSVSSLSWTRALDFDGARDAVQGTIVEVYDTTAGPFFYQLTTANPVIIGTSQLVFQALDFTPSGSGGLSIRTIISSTISPQVVPSDHLGTIIINCLGGNVTLPFYPGTLPGMTVTIIRADTGSPNAHSAIITDGTSTIATLSLDDTSVVLKDGTTKIIPVPPSVVT